MILIVFETDTLHREYVLNNDISDVNVDIASIMRGADSFSSSLDEGEKYESVIFIKEDYLSGDYLSYANMFTRFINTLLRFKLIDNKTFIH